VRDRAGNPIRFGVPQFAVDLVSTIDTRSATVDGSGLFSTQVRAGVGYTLGLATQGTSSFGGPGTDLPFTAEGVSVQSPLTFSSDTTLDIQVPSGQLTVQVVDPTGQPVPNVTVNARSVSPPGATCSLGSSLGPLPVATGAPIYTFGPVQTDNSGTASVWLYPNIPFNFTLDPGLSSPLLPTTVSDVVATSDRTLTVALPDGPGGAGIGECTLACPPPPSATPELDSSLLFASGLSGLIGYALLRRRARSKR
jgi:hypothetical protein